jgi:hypothetical protein
MREKTRSERWSSSLLQPRCEAICEAMANLRIHDRHGGWPVL